MVCDHCRAWNVEGERRCRRCGKRLAGAATETGSFTLHTAGALATAPQPKRTPPETSAVNTETAAPVERSVPRQPALFPAGRKVIPFDSLAGPRVEPAAARSAVPRTPRKPAGSRRSPEQPELDFLPSAVGAPRTLRTTVEAVIFCDAPVAAVLHRAVASSLDAGLVVIGAGMFALVFHVSGGQFTPDRTTGAIFALAFALIAWFYGAAWALAGRETPGMRWTSLRLTNFDGFPPDATQRFLRHVGACLSWSALGLGILWALVDEENLTWHDHISKTFPTFKETETAFVRKRQ